MRFIRTGISIGVLAFAVGLVTVVSAQIQTAQSLTSAPNVSAFQATATSTTAATAAPTTAPTSAATTVPTRVASPVPTRAPGTLPQTSGSDTQALPILVALTLLLLVSSLRALLRPKQS
jgi:hypothetical protein